MRHLAIAIFIGLTCILMLSSSVYADPTLPLPRMPIGGDQDGSEQPFVLHSPDYELIADVQNFECQAAVSLVSLLILSFEKHRTTVNLAFSQLIILLGRLAV